MAPTAPAILGLLAVVGTARADVLVASFNDNRIVRFNDAGQVVGTFTAGAPLNGPIDMTYAPDGSLWVSSIRAPNFEAANIIQYHGQSGALLRVVVQVTQGGLVGPCGLTFNEAPELLVCNKFGGGDILRFDPPTGQVIQPAPFIPHSTSPPGGVNAPEDIVIGPGGVIYVSENHDGSIRRFSAGGSPLGIFTDPFGFSADPQGMAFGPDGHLYVAVYFWDEVVKLDGETGEILDFISVIDPSFDLLNGGPMSIAFGPDGHLYATNYLDHRVAIINVHSLTVQGVLDVAGLLQGPTGIVFMPPPSCYANCDTSTGAPALTANDFQCFINNYAANSPYANCDGSTLAPVLTANDFQCFLNKFAAGCP